MRAVVVVAAAAAAAVILLLVLRPDDGEEDRTSRFGVQTATGAADAADENRTGTRPAVTQPVTPRRVGLDARIAIEDGGVVGGTRRLRVQRGGRVVLVVRADVSDRVHVHGYDIVAAVTPRRPARLAFRARLAGRFEIELEDRHLHLADLDVRP